MPERCVQLKHRCTEEAEQVLSSEGNNKNAQQLKNVNFSSYAKWLTACKHCTQVNAKDDLKIYNHMYEVYI